MTQARYPALLYFLPALIWGCILSYFTLLPADSIPEQLKGFNDKILHILIYCGSALLLTLGFTKFRWSAKLRLVHQGLILAICISYGGAIELVQHWLVPGRHGEWGDFWANSLGALLVVFLARLIFGTRRSKASSSP